MQGLHEYIVQVEEPLKKKHKLGDKEIYIDPTYDQTKYSNRIGKVISTPIGLETDIKVGDEVVIVHTVLMSEIYYGHRQDSIFLVDKEKGYYRLSKELIIMYRSNPSDKWKCYDIQLMVKPVKAKQTDYKQGSILLPANHFNTDVECNTNGFKKQYGTLRYINKELAKQGVKEGDEVFFSDVGDYEYNIDGEVLYCMDNRDILALL